MPSSPCEPNELKFGMWGFYHQPNNICRGDGLNLKKKKFFLNNPSVQRKRLKMYPKGGGWAKIFPYLTSKSRVIETPNLTRGLVFIKFFRKVDFELITSSL